MIYMCHVQYRKASKYTLSMVQFGRLIGPAKGADILNAYVCFSLHTFGADFVKQSNGNLTVFVFTKEAIRPGSRKGSKAKHIGLSISGHGLK